MKIKKIIAALLCMAQLFGMTAALAEDTADVTESEQVEAEATAEVEIPAAANELRIFVSTDGSDSNDGSFSSPVATIEKGIGLATALKNQNKDKTVSVNIRGGDYYLTKGINLNNISGSAGAPFVIQNYNNEEVNLKGSVKLSPRGFSQLKDAETLARIPLDARKHIGVYDLSKSGVTLTPYTVNDGTAMTGYTNLIVNGKEQTIARWPNTGFDRTAAGSNYVTVIGEQGKARSTNWKTATNAIACGYFGNEYTYNQQPIISIEGGALTLGSNPYYGIYSGKRYLVMNLLEELDSPGEYYIDTSAKLLYYYPPYNIANAEIEIARLTDDVFYADKVSYITIKGIGIKNVRNYAIKISNSDNIIIDGCSIENVGNKGIVMENNTNAQIINNTISRVGANAIVISGGDKATLTHSNNLIDNNHLYDFAYRFKTNNGGILVTGCGTTMTHNLIHTSPSQGILFGDSAEHTIQYNEFYDLVNEPCDAGAIYMGRDYSGRGHEISYNYFHDIQTTADEGGSIFVAGVYLDDMYSSANVHHNVFYNCNLAVMFGGGRDNIFTDNILLDCGTGMFMDGRGVGWANYHTVPGGQAYNSISRVAYNQEPWKSRYPELAAMMDDVASIGIPNNNTITGNVMYNCMVNVVSNETKEYGDVSNNYDEKGSDFSFLEDYEGRNFELKDGSDIAKKYPKAAEIDMSVMGLREDKADAENAKATEESFRLITPMNGQTDISNLSQTFTWEPHNYASKYVVTIAEDIEMNNVVMTAESKSNSTDISFIPSGGKPYWWTVTAVNETQSLGGEFAQYGAPKLIISTQTEKTDKSELRSNITVLTKLNDAVVEGTNPGTYKKGFKAKVETLLEDATTAAGKTDILQKDIEAINDRYDELINSIKDNINYEVVNVGTLLKDQTNWVYEDDCYTFNSDGSLILRGANKINHYRNMMYDKPLGDNVAIKFGYNVVVSSNYCIIGLQNDATFLSGGYNIIIKSNQIEIQRYVGGNNGIKSTVLNFYTSDGKWVDLEMGALKTGIGTYVYLVADGVMVDSFLDMESPYWTGDSKFVFGNPSGTSDECVTQIRAAQD